MANKTIATFMTNAPHTIGHEQNLATAQLLMKKHGIRHLPVLDGGKLAGMLSERDIYMVEAFRDVDPNNVPVSEAMSPETYAVLPETPLREVVQEMAEHQYGSAVVMEGKHVAGIFTTVDALRALLQTLE